jgi:hypothetical protein
MKSNSTRTGRETTMRLNFEDLIDMFRAALNTKNVSDYTSKEYLNLKEHARTRPINHYGEIRLAQLENDPSTRVFAMEFDDKDMKDKRTVTGSYDVVAGENMFHIKNGDYLILEQRYGTDSSKICIMQDLSFKKLYRKN